MDKINERLYNWLFELIHNEKLSELIVTILLGLSIVIICYIVLVLARKILFSVFHSIALRTKTEWDDILFSNKTFHGVAHLFPATLIYYWADFAAYYPNFEDYISKFANIYLLITAIWITNALLSSANEIYNKSFSFSKDRPIAGFIQLVKIFLYFVGFLTLIAIIFDKELGKLFTGLGAMAAIIMLVFKDTILGFVASIQISMNDMVRMGDWIAMKSRGADGDVIEMNLNTVKVQNWDKTIATIPTYALITESFINWRGMENSGGRRIKRSINIDMNSVKFCDQEMLSKLEKFVLIKDYIEQKELEIENFNKELNISPEQHYNGRRQTNLGIFRKYLEAYLKKHPKIKQDMTFLVRHLQPTEKGLPIEIYVFSNDQVWANYESIQADIFDHVLAVIPMFDLKVYQAPSGRDLDKLISQ